MFYGDVYDLPEALGMFDVVLVCAVLEHLSDPIRALASVARRCAHTMVISAEVIDTEEAVSRFAGHADRPEINFVFWVYSLGTYRQILRILGFEITAVVTRDFRYTLVDGEYPRTAIVAERRKITGSKNWAAAGIVDDAFRRLLRRPPDEGALAFYVPAIAEARMTALDLYYQISMTEEFAAIVLANRAAAGDAAGGEPS